MDISEYMGVLSSPFTTEREKERVLKKIRKRYTQEKRQEKEVELFGCFINYKKFPVAEKLVREGRNYGVEARIKDRFSILMHKEGGDVSLFVDEEFITKGTYRDVKREFKRLKKNFEKTVKEMEEMHTGKKERPQIELPSWTKHLYKYGYAYTSYEINKDGLTIEFKLPAGVSIITDKSGTRMVRKNTEMIFKAIADNEGMVYMPHAYQTPAAEEHGYYVFDRTGFFKKWDVEKDITGKVYRTRQLSDNGFYRRSHETEKSIWLEPAKINIDKYLKDFEEDDQYILLRAFHQRKKYQDSEKEAKPPNDLEKELDNLERINVSEEKTRTGTKAKI